MNYDYDLVVLGAGFAGLASAISYAGQNPDDKVAVVSSHMVEAIEPASSINGGHILPGYSLGFNKILDTLGAKDAGFLLEHSYQAASNLLQKSNFNIPANTLLGTDDETQGLEFQKEIDALNAALGTAHNKLKMLNASQIEKATGIRGIQFGLFEPNAGILKAEDYWRNLMGIASKLGIEFKNDTANQVLEHQSHVEISTTKCELISKYVTLAASENVPALLGIKDPFEFRKTTSYRFTGAFNQEIPLVGCIETTRPEYFWVHENELRFGLRSEEILAPEDVSEKIADRLGIKVARVSDVKYGAVVKRPSEMPFLQVSDRLISMYGFSGQGVALSNYLGTLSGAAHQNIGETRSILTKISHLFAKFD